MRSPAFKGMCRIIIQTIGLLTYRYNLFFFHVDLRESQHELRHEPTIDCQSPQMSGSTEFLSAVLDHKYAKLKTDMSPKFV